MGNRWNSKFFKFFCCANQWTGFCMMTASVMKELRGRNSWRLVLHTIIKNSQSRSGKKLRINGSRYSRMDQVKFLENSFKKSPQVFKAVFHKFYLVHSWILCPKQKWKLSILLLRPFLMRLGTLDKQRY